MNHWSSSYYPPRARWYSRLLLMTGGLRRHLALDRLRLPSGVPFSRAVASLLVPGLGFYLHGLRLWGKAAMGFCALLALIFIVGLGSPAGNVAFGLLLSTHVTSVIYVFEPWLVDGKLRTRLLFSAGVLFLLACLVYLPARNLIQEEWLMPLRVKGRVVIVHRLAHPRALARGAWIAYTIDGSGQNALYLLSGFGLGPVLALPGDQVCFTKSGFEVNGVPQPRLANMPQTGGWVVPEKHWFVWPEFAMSGHGDVPIDGIAATLVRVGTITEEQFVGKPFERWFGRRQLWK
jgi:hypothetical protein